MQTPIVPHSQPTDPGRSKPFFEIAIERISSVYKPASARKEGIHYWPEPLPTPSHQLPDPLVLFYPEDLDTNQSGLDQRERQAVIPMTRREVLERRSRENIKPSMQIPLGLIDKPAEQLRETFLVDLHGAGGTATGGPLLIAGAQHSGKATALQTILFWLTTRFLPEQLRYAILDPFAELTHFRTLPHLSKANGDMYWSAEASEEQLQHFTNRIYAEIQQRHDLFASQQQHPQTLSQVWSQGLSIPQLLVIISNYQLFAERTTTALLIKKLAQTVMEARALGVYLIITSTETGPRQLPQELISKCPTRIGLGLSNRQNHELFGATILPAETVPGRGWIQTPERHIQQVQLALPLSGSTESIRDTQLKLALVQNSLP
ncbi:hypothetical protein KDW_25120 [Dictyobacter vulcani]|uniref:FtsK domain-containing protein n=1 Tax=Dictyobacter vulcani TaxID=2607529 RepID=A0A5J4KPL3_9CHLR|nr:FtsK/SpoIIIE domain-containing protein [Dictyobacter vulcani]GER88350.1 hypothetical protein KDW_25120 [Dictyobacter vulcani]